jgi:hypothetical protein
MSALHDGFALDGKGYPFPVLRNFLVALKRMDVHVFTDKQGWVTVDATGQELEGPFAMFNLFEEMNARFTLRFPRRMQGGLMQQALAQNRKAK